MINASQREAAHPVPLRVLLTGFMGAGKTTVGILLAERLGWRFLDLDQHLEHKHGNSIAGIFAQHGEPHFRTLESDSLSSILGARNIVIALGGGALGSAANRDAIAATDGASLIYLEAPLDTLLDRIHKQQAAPQRPLFTDLAALQERHAARLPHYRTAELHIDTTLLDPDGVAKHIVAALGLHTLSQD